MTLLIRSLILITIITFLGTHLFAQDVSYKKHLISFSIGYAYIPQSGEDISAGENGTFVPSVGMDYLYSLTEKWEIGAVSDIELGEYVIIPRDLNREYAWIVAGMLVYKPLPSWSIFTGLGLEIEKHGNIPLFRLGTDYSINLGKDWILAPTLSLDINKEFQTFAFAVALGKAF